MSQVPAPLPLYIHQWLAHTADDLGLEQARIKNQNSRWESLVDPHPLGCFRQEVQTKAAIQASQEQEGEGRESLCQARGAAAKVTLNLAGFVWKTGTQGHLIPVLGTHWGTSSKQKQP